MFTKYLYMYAHPDRQEKRTTKSKVAIYAKFRFLGMEDKKCIGIVFLNYYPVFLRADFTNFSVSSFFTLQYFQSSRSVVYIFCLCTCVPMSIVFDAKLKHCVTPQLIYRQTKYGYCYYTEEVSLRRTYISHLLFRASIFFRVSTLFSCTGRIWILNNPPQQIR